MKSQKSDDLTILIDPDDLENLSPRQFSHRQRPSLKTTREITRFVRRYQRRLSFSPPSSPLHHSLNTKNALPAIKRGVDENKNGSNEADAEEPNSNSPRWQNNKRNHDLDLSQLNNNDPFLNNGGMIPSASKRLTEEHRHVFQTIDMQNAQTSDILTMQEVEVRVHPKVIPQLPPIGMSSLPCRPSSPLPSHRSRSRRKHSELSNTDDDWTEGKEEEEDASKDSNDEDDVTFDKTMYFGLGDEVIKIVL